MLSLLGLPEAFTLPFDGKIVNGQGSIHTSVDGKHMTIDQQSQKLIGLSRSVLHYQPRASEQNTRLQIQLVELAQERRRFGYRRLYILLRRAGVQVNHKRIYRLYRSAGLMVKRRRHRHGVAIERERLSLPSAPNQVWSMDFVFDALSTRRRIKCLTVVDYFTKEAVGILVNHGISGFRVTRAPDEMARFRGYPTAIRTDQGPEFTGKALDQWGYQRDIKLKLTQPGKPTQNAFTEFFNGKFRDECLNEHWFCSPVEARIRIAAWRRDYNEHRPHSAIGNLTPAKLAAKWRASQQQPPHEKLISTPGRTNQEAVLKLGAGQDADIPLLGLQDVLNIARQNLHLFTCNYLHNPLPARVGEAELQFHRRPSIKEDALEQALHDFDFI